jgi:hypothetical protein
MRMRNGIFTAGIFTSVFFFLAVNDGPNLESPYMRYAVAGTMSTLAVELLTHGIDTVNMRSKIINAPKIYVLNVFKLKGFLSLFKGIQAIIYGYTFSSMLYFYSYAALKDQIKITFYPPPIEI